MVPGGYLVIARNSSHLFTNYPNLNATNLLGDFSGKLSHGGERLALAKPDAHATTNSHGQLVTNNIYIVVNEVTYGTGGRWGEWSQQRRQQPRTD